MVEIVSWKGVDSFGLLSTCQPATIDAPRLPDSHGATGNIDGRMTNHEPSTLTRILKTIRPDDTERLTFKPFFKVLLNLFSLPGRALYPEFRTLPPNHLRCRVGAGGRKPPWRNEPVFLWRGYNIWMYFFASGFAHLGSDILEIGCGCGRNAYVLKHFRFLTHAFSGSYHGVDIDDEAISWCQRNLGGDRFSFETSTQTSTFYNKAGDADSRAQISLNHQSRDLVFANAVFGHVLRHQAENYFDEAARILRQGGILHVSFHCYDYLPAERQRHYTRHGDADVYVIDPEQPEKNVAFGERLMRTMLEERDFVDLSFNVDAPMQHNVTARRSEPNVGRR
jgi:SAM-dependent methyltransferase